MPRERNEVTVSGVTWRIPALLKYIAENMQADEGWKPEPTPPTESTKDTPPTRFSIHWTFGGEGEWLGYLKAHWGNEKTHEYNTCILRIIVDHSIGNFNSKGILDPKWHIATCPTLDKCKTETENFAFIPSTLIKLHTLCVKEDYNKVKTLWWE
jgi:hypothetical protein